MESEAQVQNTLPRGAKVWIADFYANDCPSNRAGRRAGVGSTRLGAIAACEPWANQAAWFRPKARSVSISDGAFDSMNYDHVRIANELENAFAGQSIDTAKLATVWLKAVTAGLVR